MTFQVLSPSVGLSDIVITGDSAVAMGKQYAYTCDATCTPSCVFTWKFMGKTFEGEQLEITISDYFKTEPLTCEATNTEFNATITATKNLTVIGESGILLPQILDLFEPCDHRKLATFITV